MIALSISFIFCLAVHNFEVELLGNNGNRDKLIEDLGEHDVTVTEVTKYDDLHRWGEWRTDGFILCEGNVKEDDFIEFINAGHSGIIFMKEDNTQIGDLIREFGIEPSRKAYGDEKCNYTAVTQQHTATNIGCNGYTFTADPQQRSKHAVYYTPFVGKNKKAFVIATQGDNDARLVIFGGDIFGTDDQAESDAEGYKAVLELCLWAFKKNGVMRYRDLTYVRHADGDVNPPELTISDNISFSIVLETYDEETSRWVGYTADDVQLEFSMLVPRIRKTLKSYGNGTFALDFQCPDIFGVYQFIVTYHARGYTPINATHQLMLHPLRHDEQPRYVRSAYPFYFVTLIMAIAVVILCVLIARSAPLFLEFPKKEEESPKPRVTKQQNKPQSQPVHSKAD